MEFPAIRHVVCLSSVIRVFCDELMRYTPRSELIDWYEGQVTSSDIKRPKLLLQKAEALGLWTA